MKKLTSEACWVRGGGNQETIWKMIRLNLWLKLIWLRNSGALGSVSVVVFLGGVLSKCLSEFQGFAYTLTITNGLECVSAPFMLRAGVFSPCPFQRHRVGDGLSPVASLTKVHQPRVALFNFCFLHNRRAMLTALSFMEQAIPSRATSLLPPATSARSFLSSTLLAVSFGALIAWKKTWCWRRPLRGKMAFSFSLIVDGSDSTRAAKSDEDDLVD